MVALFLGKCACSSNSFVSSTVGCSHAIRRCDWRWYPCLGSSRLVQACFLPRIGGQFHCDSGYNDVDNRSLLGSLLQALCAVWYFLRSPARLSACHLQINLFIDSNVALGTLFARYVPSVGLERIWSLAFGFEAAAQAALLLAWRVLSKLNLADAPTRPETCASELRALLDRGFVETEWWWPPHSPWLM